MPPNVPAGLPSALLERRPDIQQAEQVIVAANARIGVAQGRVLPADRADRIGRRGQHGAVGALHRGRRGRWRRPTVVQPIFNAGRNRSQVALAEARRAGGGPRLPADDSAGVSRSRRTRSSAIGARASSARRSRHWSRAAQDARRLADLRYQGGATSYLEVLDSDTRLFVAELGLVQAQLDELVGVRRDLPRARRRLAGLRERRGIRGYAKARAPNVPTERRDSSSDGFSPTRSCAPDFCRRRSKR